MVEVDFLRRTSRLLFAKREPALHGDEAAILSPDELMGREDAEDAAKRARKVYGLCRRLVEEPGRAQRRYESRRLSSFVGRRGNPGERQAYGSMSRCRLVDRTLW